MAMIDDSTDIYLALIVIHLGLILMILNSILDSVSEFGSSSYGFAAVIGFLSALTAGFTLIYYLITSLSSASDPD